MNKSKIPLLYWGLGLLAIPVLIIASTLLPVDESGLMTVGLFVMVGVPLGITGFILIVIALLPSKQE